MLPAAGGSQPCPQVEAERPKGLNITVSSWQRYEATTLHQTPLKKAVILPLKTKVWLAFVLPRCCQQCFFFWMSFCGERGGASERGGILERGGGFRGRMRVGLRHCNERKTSSLLVLLSYGCVYGVGAGLRLGGRGRGLHWYTSISPNRAELRAVFKDTVWVLFQTKISLCGKKKNFCTEVRTRLVWW